MHPQRSAPLTLARSTISQPVPPHFSQTACVDINSIIVQTQVHYIWVSQGRPKARPTPNGPLGRGPDRTSIHLESEPRP